MRYRTTNDSVLEAVVGLVFFGGWVLLCLALAVLKLWVIGSLLTSSIKAVSNDCGQTYGVESILSGNWLCPSENTK